MRTSWLEVDFNQASPDSPTLELLGHNVAGSSPAQKIQKGPPHTHHQILGKPLFLNDKKNLHAPMWVIKGMEKSRDGIHRDQIKVFNFQEKKSKLP